MSKQCAVCGKQLKLLDSKYDLKDKTKLCTDCASKFGFTKFSFKELSAAREMTSEQVQVFIKDNLSIDPKQYLKEVKLKGKEKQVNADLINKLLEIDLNELKTKPEDTFLKDTEFEYFRINNADWLEQRKITKRVNYSGSSASFHITKNIKYYSGSIKPKRISTEEWKNIRSGRLILTNKRLLLIGNDTKQILINSIVDINGFSDGIGLMRSSGKDIILKFNNESTDNINSFYIILGRILTNDFRSHYNNESEYYTPQEFTEEMIKKGAKEISFENDCYIIDLSKSIIYEGTPVLTDINKNDIKDLSNKFNKRTNTQKTIKVFGSDSLGNLIELYAVNGNKMLYDIDETEKVKQTAKTVISSDNKSVVKKKATNSSLITDSDYDNLKKLKSLLDEGILTQEEFDAKKKQILKL
ncbi:hypothetical protein DS832_06860 [Bombilactobacillus bombi]|uniref:SHOCT domain-containing protein n=1 Tax=Bombilactobacillus bombi TaxID=1303590 RepID=A0A417Z630_9LACO|nr:SHOCT domain-containing protein [Bombilactobacillus bombi]RHW46065.1 hypothetical protein DS832_06860 [Bombilactobacillus bombi]